MGSTNQTREVATCPNCGVIGTAEETTANEKDYLIDCHNVNCAVDRFWGTPEWEQ